MFTGSRNKKLLETSILVGALFVLSYCISAQDPIPDTLSETPDAKITADALIIDDTLVIKAKKHNPKVATLSSAILPGAGQIYNRKYWKLPIIYGTGAFLVYNFDRNNSNYQRFKKAFDQSKNDLEITDPDLQEFNLTELERGRDFYRKNRDYQIIFLGLLYTANIIDALVDAYLFKYDISRDLSLKMGPEIIPLNYNSNAACGVRVQLLF